MESHHQILPELMQKLHKLEFDYSDGQGIDFEPYETFLSAEETGDWFQAWTGNSDVDGDSFLIFGQDGTGGYAAFWRVRDNEDLLAQPIIFLGSEGELGIVSQNFSDYLWLLASGHGPYEAIAYPDDEKSPNLEFLEFAKQNATTPQSKPTEIIARAQAEFADFEEHILSLCK